MELETTRLRLEPFELAHFDGLRAMESDPEIMRYISNGVVKTPEETLTSIERVQSRWQQYGFSWWAMREKESGEIVGACCLQHLANQDGAPLEIGWRLNANYHGKGFATEAAQAIVKFAVEQVGVKYLVAVADPENAASQKVMQRLGMTYKAIEQHYDVPCVVYELHL
ncbi:MULTISPECIES: GNAT family N-acetyltransferase [Pantoea]|uniref:GNAT family N-acetyltransferase n=1 Tax=Pantoea sp. BJ2 TaxID=3141322 RepID=A0AAU7U1A4_9GAMM|nr:MULTISPECIES: GNAT family N-acetyltransferase [Pantoea]PYG49781.1 RimJ/RimL family protein N-acetyltransferase [Pantoea sp. AG1095]